MALPEHRPDSMTAPPAARFADRFDGTMAAVNFAPGFSLTVLDAVARGSFESRAMRAPGVILHCAGHALIAGFARLQEALDGAARRLERSLADLPHAPAPLLRHLMMQTSTRNAWRCTVTTVTEGPVHSLVEMALADSQVLTAAITAKSAAEMRLAPGCAVHALVKASFILLVPGRPSGPVSARNQLAGTVAARHDGAVSSEIVLDIGGGKTVTAIVTADGAERLRPAAGPPIAAPPPRGMPDARRFPAGPAPGPSGIVRPVFPICAIATLGSRARSVFGAEPVREQGSPPLRLQPEPPPGPPRGRKTRTRASPVRRPSSAAALRPGTAPDTVGMFRSLPADVLAVPAAARGCNAALADCGWPCA
ncbi:TOBE domain-containing protein [Mangrovicoccus ximenensis]|uniref:TOBE domain-containing protein n=1 Tax=Mangrovicoccus ximenensis TaxID=1911570 RepID=UPI000D38F808|nr:TOBE domain-containing protein [Mangrovicoccus ximenensis]